jgi:hypothetical protein
MARQMTYTVVYDAPLEKIYQDLTSQDYWQTLMDAYRLVSPQSEMTRFHTDEAGTDIVFKQVLPRSDLPPIARTVMPVDMIITREQHFDPFDHSNNRAHGSYAASVPHGPGHLGGTYLITETDTGAQLRIASECRVHIPFVGGKLEDLILHNIKQLFDAEEAFTADWIARHH